MRESSAVATPTGTAWLEFLHTCAKATLSSLFLLAQFLRL